MGEAFINAVAGERGVSFANLVWAGPDYLPTLDELRNHRAWIARVEQLPAPADSPPTRSLNTAPLPEDSL